MTRSLESVPPRRTSGDGTRQKQARQRLPVTARFDSFGSHPRSQRNIDDNKDPRSAEHVNVDETLA